MKCAIVLAAGRSERMGARKVLLPFGASTVIGHVVDAIARSSIDRIIVVVGSDPEPVAKAAAGGLRGRPASIVSNPDPDAGMLSSVRCGLRAVPPQCEAVLVALGDQPRIATAVIDAVVRAFDRSGGGAERGAIVVPVHRGRRGHPLLFAVRHRAEVLERYDAVGLRGLLAAHPGDVLELELEDAAILSDMDAPADYLRERNAYEGERENVRGTEG